MLSDLSTPSPGKHDSKLAPEDSGATSDLAKALSTQNEKANSTQNEKANKLSSIVTFKPYLPSKNQTDRTKYHEFDRLYGPQNWTKYFNVSSPDDDLSLYSNLSSLVDKNLTFKRTVDGHRVVEAQNGSQSVALAALMNENLENLKITENEKLNVRVGTVVIPNSIYLGLTSFVDCTYKIKENLECQNFDVVDVFNFVRPPRGKRTHELKVSKITFKGRVLPSTVIIGGQRLEVREYISNPRQCGKCWKYGHPGKYCKNVEDACPICSQTGHKREACNIEPPSCSNCRGSHPAFSKACPIFKNEKLIMKCVATEGLRYLEAKKKLKREGLLVFPHYANVAQKNIQRKELVITSSPISDVVTSNPFSSLANLDDDEDLPDLEVTSERETRRASPPRPRAHDKRMREDNSGEIDDDGSGRRIKKKEDSQNAVKIMRVEVDVHKEQAVLPSLSQENIVADSGETSKVAKESNSEGSAKTESKQEQKLSLKVINSKPEQSAIQNKNAQVQEKSMKGNGKTKISPIRESTASPPSTKKCATKDANQSVKQRNISKPVEQNKSKSVINRNSHPSSGKKSGT